MKDFEILIDDIPEEGLEIKASEGDPWLNEAVCEAVGDIFGQKGTAKLRVDIHQINHNVNLAGEVILSTYPACDRCLIQFEEKNKIPLHTVLAPLYESKRQKEREGYLEGELVKEDLEFGFYEGDRFDLADVVRELIVLSMPMKHLCKESCKGLCQHCGKDLNKGKCKCHETEKHSSFDVLRDFKLKKSKIKKQISK